MVEEIYEVLDPRGRTRQFATWTEVHTLGYLHGVAHGIVFEDESKARALLKKRADTEPHEPGVYEIAVAGHILFGDTPDLTVRVEHSEELHGGKTAEPTVTFEKVEVFRNNDFPGNCEEAHLFVIIDPGPFVEEAGHAGDMRWVDWTALCRDIELNPTSYATFTINAINAYLTFLESQ